MGDSTFLCFSASPRSARSPLISRYSSVRLMPPRLPSSLQRSLGSHRLATPAGRQALADRDIGHASGAFGSRCDDDTLPLILEARASSFELKACRYFDECFSLICAIERPLPISPIPHRPAATDYDSCACAP